MTLLGHSHGSSIVYYVDMTLTTSNERTAMPKLDTREDVAARLWDSERRSSPYSTVADPYNDDDHCEACDSAVDYSAGYPGRCRCES